MFEDIRLPPRFWKKVDPNGPEGIHSQTGASLGPCWIWTRALSSGYGEWYVGLREDGSRHIGQTHRSLYLTLVGPIPKGLELDHLCRVRACCNPDHLEVVTTAENSRRGNGVAVRKANMAAITHCPHGHEYTVENTRVYMTRGYPCRHCMACTRDRNRERARRRRGM